MRRIFRLPGLVLLLLVGCSRALPDPAPASPIDPNEAGPKPLAVDVALRGDPPLPGQPREGWPGLVEPKSDGHEHHQHHKHHEPEPAKGGGHAHH
jgi:hypothetical protein